MTVLFCFHFNEKNNGGVKSLLDMLDVFSESGARIIAAFPFKDGTAIDYLRKKGITVIYVPYVFYVHPDEIESLTREFAAIGNNLNQIAAFFNSGGMASRMMRENINRAIGYIFEMRGQVAEMAGKNCGNLKAYRK